jgi:hypothetical protein
LLFTSGIKFLCTGYVRVIGLLAFTLRGDEVHSRSNYRNMFRSIGASMSPSSCERYSNHSVLDSCYIWRLSLSLLLERICLQFVEEKQSDMSRLRFRSQGEKNYEKCCTATECSSAIIRLFQSRLDKSTSKLQLCSHLFVSSSLLFVFHGVLQSGRFNQSADRSDIEVIGFRFEHHGCPACAETLDDTQPKDRFN